MILCDFDYDEETKYQLSFLSSSLFLLDFDNEQKRLLRLKWAHLKILHQSSWIRFSVGTQGDIAQYFIPSDLVTNVSNRMFLGSKRSECLLEMTLSSCCHSVIRPVPPTKNLEMKAQWIRITSNSLRLFNSRLGSFVHVTEISRLLKPQKLICIPSRVCWINCVICNLLRGTSVIQYEYLGALTTKDVERGKISSHNFH